MSIPEEQDENQQDQEREYSCSATYDPLDNKIRVSCVGRFSESDFRSLKAAGYAWAPQQKIMIAPMWTPEREDIALELAGEIEDEDTSLVDRAEVRAERFQEYSENRKEDAIQAQNAVSAIADGIPLGQPILVGHHSERHARKDAERIENGMRKAVKMWDTSAYWKSRAAGAIRHAKYKERPDVRARRIKGIEADLRKQEKTKAHAEKCLDLWTKLNDPEAMRRKDKEGNVTPTTPLEKALFITNYIDQYSSFRFPLAEYPRTEHTYEGEMGLWSALDYGIITAEQAKELAVPRKWRIVENSIRWIRHLENRLVYERAMLEEAGGLAAEKFEIQVGGRVLVRGEWAVVLRLNKKDGQLVSVSTTARYGRTRSLEQISDYRPPEAGEAEKVAAVMKLPPMCNYPGEGFKHMLAADWKRRQFSDCPKSATIKATETHGTHRVRSTPGEGSSYWKSQNVYLTDEKRKDPPKLDGAPEPPKPKFERQIETPSLFPSYTPREKTEDEKQAQAARDALKAGVSVVVAPQLFPTPREIAEQMADLADLQPGECVLEPSAGTGVLVEEILKRVDTEVLAYEINGQLAGALAIKFPSYKLQVRCKDFLEVTDFQGCYPRILMNPPFERGADIAHIRHAIKFLAPNGRLVAICANGPRQQEELKPLASQWIDLPADSFKEQGTGVNTAMLVIEN